MVIQPFDYFFFIWSKAENDRNNLLKLFNDFFLDAGMYGETIATAPENGGKTSGHDFIDI